MTNLTTRLKVIESFIKKLFFWDKIYSQGDIQWLHTQFCPFMTTTYLQVDIFNPEQAQKWAFFGLLKGQIISKWFFGVFDFLQKTSKNKLTWGIIVVKSNSFVHVLEEIKDTKNQFEIIWPLPPLLVHVVIEHPKLTLFLKISSMRSH